MSKPVLFQYVSIPLSWPITWLAQRLGFSPNGATAARAAIAACGLVMLTAPSTTVYHLGAAIYFFALVSDQVDGNLCRIQDTSSYLGKYLDGLVDAFTEPLVPLTIGVHIFLATGSAEAVWFGTGTAFLLITLQTTYLRFAVTAKEIAIIRLGGAPALARGSHLVERLLQSGRIAAFVRPFEGHGLDILWDIRYGGLLLTLAFGHTELYLAAVFVAHLIVWIVLVPVLIARAIVELDVHRKSRSDSDYNRTPRS